MNKNLGKETFLECDDKRYRLSRFGRCLADEFVAWATKKLGNPMASLDKDIQGLPPEIQKAIALQAYKDSRKKRTFHDEEVQALFQSPEGILYTAELCLRKYHPELTHQEVSHILEQAEEEYGLQFYAYLGDKITEASGIVTEGEKEAEKNTLTRMGVLEDDSRSFRLVRD